jgi:hypothetical protein
MNEQTRGTAEIEFSYEGANVFLTDRGAMEGRPHLCLRVETTGPDPATARQAVRDKLREIRNAIDEELSR